MSAQALLSLYEAFIDVTSAAIAPYHAPVPAPSGTIESVLLGKTCQEEQIRGCRMYAAEGAETGERYGAMAAGAVPYITCEACILLTKHTDATTRLNAPAWSLKSKKIVTKKKKREQQLRISAKARSTLQRDLYVSQEGGIRIPRTKDAPVLTSLPPSLINVFFFLSYALQR